MIDRPPPGERLASLEAQAKFNSEDHEKIFDILKEIREEQVKQSLDLTRAWTGGRIFVAIGAALAFLVTGGKPLLLWLASVFADPSTLVPSNHPPPGSK